MDNFVVRHPSDPRTIPAPFADLLAPKKQALDFLTFVSLDFADFFQ
jgi:hypothetical protein